MNFVAKIPTQFKTARLTIKRCDPTFSNELFEAASQSVKEVYPFLAWCHPDYALIESTQWLTFARDQWNNGKAFGFSIFSSSDGR
jgi:hypothetical protein